MGCCFWLVLFVLLVWFCGLGLVCFRVGFLVIVEFVFCFLFGVGLVCLFWGLFWGLVFIV